MTKRRLPVLVERSIGHTLALRSDTASHFEAALVSEVKGAGLSITCTPGCASCCYFPITVSILEAVPIYHHLLQNRKWTIDLRRRLQDTYERQMSVTYEVWLLSLNPCALLSEDKKCLAYDERPLSCRVMVSVGDPFYCHPHRMGEQTKMVPREGVMSKYNLAEAKTLRKHRVQVQQIPLGLALLLAERVSNGDLDISAVDSEVLKEFAKYG
jgi:Fe-S-cluster containining protein